MNSLHKELLEKIKKNAGNGSIHSGNDSYLSSGHQYYNVSVPIKRAIAREWVKEHKTIPTRDLLALLDSLFQGKSYEEKTLAGILLGYLPQQRKEIDPEQLNTWLNYLNGWAEVDTLCQSTFTAEEVVAKWEVWVRLLKKLAKSENPNKKRASLVLLTGSVSHSDSKNLVILSFELVDALKSEKSILITKAISWLLRSLIKYHKEAVQRYVSENEDTLPRIAVWETKRKLTLSL